MQKFSQILTQRADSSKSSSVRNPVSTVGAALLQAGQSETFTSRVPIPTERNYVRIERELFVTLHARDRFHQYVFARDINIKTHYKSSQKRLENLF